MSESEESERCEMSQTENNRTIGEKLAKRLKKDNPEHFLNLVRMHLSFVLDSNSTENIPETIQIKNSILKESQKTIKKSSIGSKMLIFGKKDHQKPKDQNNSLRADFQETFLSKQVLKQIGKLIVFLDKKECLEQEGIFRRTGSINRQQDLRNLLLTNEQFLIEAQSFNVHDCASVLKNFLADLSEPLLTDQLFVIFTQFADFFRNLKEKNRLLFALQLVCQLLPHDNCQLFKDLIFLLHKTISFVHLNKMTADSLATLFTPHLLCPRHFGAEKLHSASQHLAKVLSYMISNANDLFAVPSQLILDLKAYWAHKHHSSTAVNTVFSFVDREQTAKANTGDSTQLALAELYAHIQSMPESAKKRKFIKQFNKENGQGTPLMVKQCASSNVGIRDMFRRKIFKSSNEKVNNKKRSILSGRNSYDVPQIDSPSKTPLAKRMKLTPSSCMLTPKSSNNQITAVRLLLRKSLSESNLNDYMANGARSETSTKRPFNDTLMTPRSRKPVLLKSTLNICQMRRKTFLLKKSKSDTNLILNCDKNICNYDLSNPETSSNELTSGDGESLTTTFREYLSSRLNSTSHIIEDLSFSSRTGDFVKGGDDNEDDDDADDNIDYNDDLLHLTESEMSESLLRILNGDLPPNICSPDNHSAASSSSATTTAAKATTTTTCLSCKQVNLKKFTGTSF